MSGSIRWWWSCVFVALGCSCVPGEPVAEAVPLPDLEFPWAVCELDPSTLLPDPGCVAPPPVVMHLAVAARDAANGGPMEGVDVSVSAADPGVYVLPQEHLEAVPLPNAAPWNEDALGDQVWAELSYGTSVEPGGTFDTVTDEEGVALVFVLVEEMPGEAEGNATESTLLVSVGDASQTLRLIPLL